MLDVEATDDQSTISFVTSPLSEEKVAGTIVNVIERPRPEVILPVLSGKSAGMLALFPGLFHRFYRVANRVGRKNLHSYREHLSTVSDDIRGEGKIV